MTRLITIAAALGCLSLVALLPALSQEAKNPKGFLAAKPREETLATIRLLERSIETRGLHEPVKLKDAVEYLSDRFAGKLTMLVDQKTFADELGPKSKDPYETEVRLPSFPREMPMAAILHTILSQLGNGKATYVIHPGWLEITTEKASKAANAIVRPCILAAFDRGPLPEVVQQLADQAGVAVHLDPNIGARADTRISATFRNASLEEALVTVTEMAKLKYVVLDRGIYVTTPEHAKAIEREETIRSKKRGAATRVPTGIPGLPRGVQFMDPGQDRFAIMRMLEQPIETKGLREKVKLKNALEYFGDKFDERLLILVNIDAFAEGTAEPPDLYEEEVSLPAVPAKMLMGTALRLVLAQVGKGEATYVIRKGWIEITSERATRAANSLYRPSIVASFEEQPMPEILRKLSDQADVAINLDPNIGNQASVAISATFLNCSLEEALVAVTEMAKLKYVVLERSIYVTTPTHARVMESEEMKRSKQRDSVPRPLPGKMKRLESAA